MAQTKKSWQDYLTASFGEHGQVKPGTNALEVGAAAQGGGAFERLPIGTSSVGTAVLVDLIGSEAVSVTVGTVGIHGWSGTAGTATLGRLTHTGGKLDVIGTVTGVGVLADGTIAEVGTVTGVGVLAAGSVVTTAGTITTQLAGTQELLGTVQNLNGGTITSLQGGTLGNLAGGSVVVTSGTIGDLDTIGTIGVIEAGTITSLQGGTLGNLNGGSVVITAGTVDSVNMPHSDYFGSVGTIGGTATGTVHALVSGSAIIVTDLVVSSEGAGTLILGDGTPTVKLAEVYFGAGGNAPVPGLKTPIRTSSGSALVFSTGGGTMAVTTTGYID